MGLPRESGHIVHIERRVGKTQVNFPLNPIAQFPDTDRARVFVLQDRGGCAVARKAFLQGFFLVLGL